MFRFMIRDGIWLAALLAMTVVWVIDHGANTWNRRLSEEKFNLAERKLQELGWRIRVMPNGREILCEKIYRPE